MVLDIKRSLNYQQRCPACKTDWVGLNHDLYAGTTKQYKEAIQVLKKCDICRWGFQDIDFSQIEAAGVNP